MRHSQSAPITPFDPYFSSVAAERQQRFERDAAIVRLIRVRRAARRHHTPGASR
jgi:hypothetical protein